VVPDAQGRVDWDWLLWAHLDRVKFGAPGAASSLDWSHLSTGILRRQMNNQSYERGYAPSSRPPVRWPQLVRYRIYVRWLGVYSPNRGLAFDK